MRWLTVQVAPVGARAACTSSAVKPSLFFIGEDEKYDCIEEEAGIMIARVLLQRSEDVHC